MIGRCEDFPCCGHEAGCCPDFDEAGNQLNMKCTCGAVLPIDSRFSICDVCLDDGEGNNDDEHDDCEYDVEPYEMSDVEADADTLASAGYGTDEDYGG